MNIKALILQHEKTTPAGSTTEWLESRGFSYQIAWPSQDSALPSLESFDFLVICGGSMNVDEEEKFPWLRTEKKLIRDSILQKKKVVGLCLGGQLISEALGGTVGKHPQYEVGWHAVELSGGATLHVFQWHGYSFTLPPGAELLASNSNCKYQGFTFGNHVLGFQFHPETTAEWAEECAANPRLPKEGFVQTAEEIRRDIRYQPALKSWYFAQLDSLVSAELSKSK